MSNSDCNHSPSLGAIAAMQSRLGAIAQFQAGVTGIGSLPHTDPEEAVRFIAELCPEIPFWPQLPRRNAGEYMLLQMMTPLLDLLQPKSAARIEVRSSALFQRRLRTAEAAFDASSAAGFCAFEEGCAAGLFDNARILKGQLSGPLTLGRCLFIGDERPQPLMLDSALMNDLTDYLARLAVWQVERLARFGRPVMLFVDEPALSPALSTSQQIVYLRRVLDAIRQAGALAGVHCCASGAASALFEAAPDVISFDAYSELEVYMATPGAPRFLAQGGGMAFGLIPTLADPLEVSVEALFRRWQKAAASSEPNALAQQSLITASCGLGLLSECAARASFEQAQRLSALLRTELLDASVQWPLSNRWFCHLVHH